MHSLGTSLDGKQSRLTLFLSNSPQSLRQYIAEAVIATALSRGNSGSSFQTFEVGRVLVPFFRRLTIVQRVDPGETVTFPSFTLANGVFSDIPIQSRWMTKEEASHLRDRLVKKSSVVRFDVAVDLNARFTQSDTAVKVTSLKAKDIKAVTDLAGAGSEFQWTINAQGVAVGNGQTVLTRKQKQQFEGALREELQENWEVENERDRAVIGQRITAYLSKTFTSVQIPLDDKFASGLAALSQYGFAPSDLKPAELTKFAGDLKKSFQDEQNHILDASLATKVNVVGIFDAGMDAKFHTQEYRKTLDDLGWKFETEGSVAIPKSLEVYAVDDTQLKSDINVTVSLKGLYRGVQTVNDLVSSDLSFWDASTDSQKSNPTGTVAAFAGNPANPPVGWLLCDGTEVPIAKYPALSKVLSGLYGKPGKAGYFMLPNYEGQFLRGLDPKGKIDPDGATRVIGSMQPDSVGTHTHGHAVVELVQQTRPGQDANYWLTNDFNPAPNLFWMHRVGMETLDGAESRPKNVAVSWIIKY